jgi:hypothetical protein
VSKKVYCFDPNPLQLEELQLEFGPQTCRLSVVDRTGRHTLTAGAQAWVLGQSSIFQGDVRHALVAEAAPRPVAGAYAWTAADALQIQARFYETPFLYTLTCKFEDGQVTLQGGVNVSFGPAQMPTLVGRAV